MSNVTLSVDMSEYTGAQTLTSDNVFIAADFTNWNPVLPLSLKVGSLTVYEYTIDMTEGAEIEYKFVIGGWADGEDLSNAYALDTTNLKKTGPFINRAYTVGNSDVVLDTVYWNNFPQRLSQGGELEEESNEVEEESNPSVIYANKNLYKTTLTGDVSRQSFVNSKTRGITIQKGTILPKDIIVTKTKYNKNILIGPRLNYSLQTNREINISNKKMNRMRARGAIFQDSTIINTDVTNSTIINTQYIDVDLTGSDFSGSTIENSSFENTNLSKVKVANVTIKGNNPFTDFQKVVLSAVPENRNTKEILISQVTGSTLNLSNEHIDKLISVVIPDDITSDIKNNFIVPALPSETVQIKGKSFRVSKEKILENNIEINETEFNNEQYSVQAFDTENGIIFLKK